MKPSRFLVRWNEPASPVASSCLEPPPSFCTRLFATRSSMAKKSFTMSQAKFAFRPGRVRPAVTAPVLVHHGDLGAKVKVLQTARRRGHAGEPFALVQEALAEAEFKPVGEHADTPEHLWESMRGECGAVAVE